MKKLFFILVLTHVFMILCYSQSEKLDTIYYDKDWKGVSSPAFATYYRVIEVKDNPNVRGSLRDYFITGELQAEGGYLSIDRNDDKNSIFDGEMTWYYKNGLVEAHVTKRNGKSEGIYTNFNETGDLCMQMEMYNDEPVYNYYVLSNKDGYCSKIRISDNTPIYESPSLSEMKVDYRDGAAWPYYIKNGIMVAMTNTQVKDYGKWFQITLIISNKSIAPIEFDPELITSSLQKKNGKTVALEVWSSERYMRKVSRNQNWNMALVSIGEGLAAAGAGYSTSTTQTNSTYNGYSNSYGNAYAYGSGGYAYGIYNENGSYHGNSSTTSRTTTYDGAAAYQAQVIASNRIANYETSLLNERAIKEEGYLRKTTIYPGEAICGYVNIKRISGLNMNVIVDINGAKYEFPWNLTK